jgi:hypothetical protein
MRGAIALPLVTALACRAAPPAAPPAPFHWTMHQGADTRALFAGPAPGRQPWWLRVDCAWVERLEPGAGVPLGSAARHVVARGAAHPLPPRGELALGGRWLPDAVALGGERVELARERQALLDGALWIGALQPVPNARAAVRPAWRSFAFELARWEDRAELTLVFHGAPPAARERLSIAAELAPGAGPARWFLPTPRPDAPLGGVVLELALETFVGDDPRSAAALEHAERHLRDAVARAREEMQPLSRDEGAHLERAQALRALADPALRRAAFFHLADAGGARLAADLALLDDDDALAACAAAVLEDRGERSDDVLDGPRLAWSLEVAAARALLMRAPELPAELQASLLARAGELARFPDLLGACVESSSDLADFEARLERENRQFLEDSDPAARVRAHDWLAARGVACPGYDPLGSREQRRSALAAWPEESP